MCRGNNILVLWVMTPCTLVYRYQYFGGACCLHLHKSTSTILQMLEACSSYTLVPVENLHGAIFYKTAIFITNTVSTSDLSQNKNTQYGIVGFVQFWNCLAEFHQPVRFLASQGREAFIRTYRRSFIDQSQMLKSKKVKG